jgi:hypothetical protein
MGIRNRCFKIGYQIKIEVMTMDINEIHESLVNGQRRQMVEQIDKYGVYDFWDDYRNFLNNMYYDGYGGEYIYFSDAVISYFRIKGR